MKITALPHHLLDEKMRWAERAVFTKPHMKKAAICSPSEVNEFMRHQDIKISNKFKLKHNPNRTLLSKHHFPLRIILPVREANDESGQLCGSRYPPSVPAAGSLSARPVLGAEVPPRPTGVLPSRRCASTSYPSFTVTSIIDVRQSCRRRGAHRQGWVVTRYKQGWKVTHYLVTHHCNLITFPRNQQPIVSDYNCQNSN